MGTGVRGGADCRTSGGAASMAVSRGIAIAVKLADGNLRALNAVTLAVLQQLGWLEKTLPPALAAFDAPVIRNWLGTPTGEVRCCVRLAAA